MQDLASYEHKESGCRVLIMKSKKKLMFCVKCGGMPIIKVDNAKEYVCWKCLIKFLNERTKGIKWKKK